MPTSATKAKTGFGTIMGAVRYLWALPATCVGLFFALLAICAGATVRVVDGAVEVAGGRIPGFIARLPSWARFGAITFGHVIIGTGHGVLERARAHEHVHVRQYERWGVLFFPLYAGSSLVQLLKGRDPYWNNCFEREAYARCPDAEDPLPRQAGRRACQGQIHGQDPAVVAGRALGWHAACSLKCTHPGPPHQ